AASGRDTLVEQTLDVVDREAARARHVGEDARAGRWGLIPVLSLPDEDRRLRAGVRVVRAVQRRIRLATRCDPEVEDALDVERVVVVEADVVEYVLVDRRRRQ